MKFKVCCVCGAALDHGERCECEREAAELDRWEARPPIKGRQLSLDDLMAKHLRIDKEAYRR